MGQATARSGPAAADEALDRLLIDGFSLHAAVRCAADDRQALERLCRYKRPGDKG